ncbi:MAG: type II toxin-antitoxin system RelE/ParE family toxin [Gammaproteobacteria bacterium]|nr:type II toxin-antitoxin system RelE/ParE family toxin [Gammaproteobacteria bacterium]MCF6362256.1 type II toxin-antitoxin system RelE/ParE family toxin [Gammaproteobacteria bacterium]
MKIKILKSASQDLIDGYWFYEKQSEGIGTYFLDTLFSDIDSLILNAGIHSIHFGKYHRLLSKRFPFSVYYYIEEDAVLIYAVLDCRKKPAWIRDKLKKR